ncbi:MAG: 5'-methylthioadenosine/adenosylhomocysteine nucleosidase [Paludibacteraceae bacterium]|nr:5'-methylthioadenosine/adenosylhomocysteine nucleosidase [Paludibacteraceae bacterium]
MKLGIMGAMHEEVEGIIAHIEQKKITETSNRIFYEGLFFGKEVVVVFSRWGKVAAAITATILIQDFKVDKIIFTGIAGAVVPDLKLGDIVIGQRYFQHDMDARPLLKRYEIPLTGKTSIVALQNEVELAANAVHNFLKNAKEFRKELAEHQINVPSMYLGDIASGDLFVSGAQRKANINKNLPSVLCVEMEGAAVAQVCFDFNLPFVVIRSISDTANENFGIDAENALYFSEKLAAQYSLFIMKEYVSLLQQH